LNKIETRLTELGIQLPEVPKPGSNYLPSKRTGNLIYIAGQISIENGIIKNADFGKI
jgi:enamine deaminase RidA (YjgF/YER057c/UK114 family)